MSEDAERRHGRRQEKIAREFRIISHKGMVVQAVVCHPSGKPISTTMVPFLFVDPRRHNVFRRSISELPIRNASRGQTPRTTHMYLGSISTLSTRRAGDVGTTGSESGTMKVNPHNPHLVRHRDSYSYYRRGQLL
jgi:hypothetical protein